MKVVNLSISLSLIAFIVAFSIPDCCIPTFTIFEVYVGNDNSVVACNANNINIVNNIVEFYCKLVYR